MESTNLVKAREALAAFEAHIGEQGTAERLTQCLDLLDEAVANGGQEATVAANIANRYVTIAVEHINQAVAAGTMSQVQLEQAFSTLVGIEQFRFGDKDAFGKVKLATFGQLFDSYYHGYTEEQKREVLERALRERGT
jgi:hypothetical protein